MIDLGASKSPKMGGGPVEPQNYCLAMFEWETDFLSHQMFGHPNMFVSSAEASNPGSVFVLLICNSGSAMCRKVCWALRQNDFAKYDPKIFR